MWRRRTDQTGSRRAKLLSTRLPAESKLTSLYPSRRLVPPAGRRRRLVSVEFWRMGATPVPSAEIERFARDFEDAGWDGVAVGEAHGLLPDPYIVLARAGAATSTLQLGTAVAVPLRAPLLAASA